MLSCLLAMLVWHVVAAPPTVSSSDEDVMPTALEERPDATVEADAAAVPADTNAVAAVEEETPVKFTRPTLQSVAETVKQLQAGLTPSAYEQFFRLMAWDMRNDRSINEFFQKCTEYSVNVVKLGDSPNVKRMIELSRRDPYTRKEGTHVVVFHPRVLTTTVGGKTVSKPFEEVCPVGKIVDAADQAFETTATSLALAPFLYWGDRARAKVFLIADATHWNLFRPGSGGARPVNTITSEDRYREFYARVSGATVPYLDQAVAYAVAELVAREYSTIVGRLSRPKLPLFLQIGIAADASGLTSVLTEQGPRQVRRLGAKEVTPAMLLQLRKLVEQGKRSSAELPLQESRLLTLDRLTGVTSYPSDPEDTYYIMRQSVALLRYLRENGALAYAALARDLVDGKDVARAFDGSYVKMRDTVVTKKAAPSPVEAPRDARRDRGKDKGKSARETTKAGDYTPDDVLKAYKMLRSRAKDAIFQPLTELPTSETNE